MNLLNHPLRFAALAIVMLAFSQSGRAQNAPLTPTPADASQFPAIVTLRMEKPAILLGEPIFMIFEVGNPTDSAWRMVDGGDYRNRLNRPESFKVEVRDDKGNLFPQLDAGIGMGGLIGIQTIPAQDYYRKSLFLPHWATITTPGRYQITVRRTLSFCPSNFSITDVFKPKNELTNVPTQATTTVDVLPPDSQKMGDLIQGWGNTVLQPAHVGYDNAVQKLRTVGDRRAIPFLIQLAQRSNPDLNSILALGDFNDDTAFQALLRLTQAKKEKYIPNAQEPRLAQGVADSVRFTAVQAIARSPHAGAAEILLNFRHDPYEAVRLAVVQNIGTLPSERARAVWREMERDSDSMVRSEAVRCLKQSGSKT